MKNYLNHFKTISDFPKPGVLFYDISPLLRDPHLARDLICDFSENIKAYDFDVIAGIDARGFIFGAMLANHLNKGFVMMRKPGKLPGELIQCDYSLEYGNGTLCVQKNLLKPKERVLIIDDVLATGGTAKVAVSLVASAGAEVAACAFLLEIATLNGRALLGTLPVVSLVRV